METSSAAVLESQLVDVSVTQSVLGMVLVSVMVSERALVIRLAIRSAIALATWTVIVLATNLETALAHGLVTSSVKLWVHLSAGVSGLQLGTELVKSLESLWGLMMETVLVIALARS